MNFPFGYNKSTSTDSYLAKEGVDSESIKAYEISESIKAYERVADGEHRRLSQKVILLAVVPLLTIVPIWLMILLTLSGTNRLKFSEQMQYAFLATGIADCMGLCYIVTRHLFPITGQKKEGLLDESDTEDGG